jgi:hypothetical protein
MSARDGFTLRETVLIVVFFGLAIFALVVGFVGRSGRDDRRIKCAMNLKFIGTALHMYEADNNNEMPALRPSADYTAEPMAVDGRDALENQGACIAQAWWLLVDAGHVSERSFECPSDGGYERPEYAPGRPGFGFENELNVSYGLQPTTRDESLNVAWPGAPGQSPGTYVAGDRPAVAGGYILLDHHTPNHGGRGTNLLTVGGNVKWNDSEADGEAKNQVGVRGNNIYAADLDEEGERTRNGTRLLYPDDSLLYTTRSD